MSQEITILIEKVGVIEVTLFTFMILFFAYIVAAAFYDLIIDKISKKNKSKKDNDNINDNN